MFRLFAALALVAQAAEISLSSGSAPPGGTTSLGISLASGGAQVSAIQFTLGYSSADLTVVNVLAGAGASAANKTVQCSTASGRTICVVAGSNANILPDGILASVAFQVASTPTATALGIQVTGVVASTPQGQALSGAGAGGKILVSGPGAISGRVSDKATQVTLTLSGASSATTLVDSGGNYSFNSLGSGSYVVTPSKWKCLFTPTSRSAAVSGSSVILNFKSYGSRCQ